MSVGLQFIFFSFLKVVRSDVCCSDANILLVDVPQTMLENILLHQLTF